MISPKRILIIFLLVLPAIGSAQVTLDTAFVDDDKTDVPVCGNTSKGGYVWFPEVEAQFPGGPDSLMRFIANNLDYPPCGIHQVQGKVYISMIIEKDGSHTNHEVIKGFLKQYDEAALECIKKMPPWIPAEFNGEKVRSRVRLPITFMIQ